MTIDAHGRSHRPAGSPASTGGQFAAEQAPGQAQSLGLSPEQRGRAGVGCILVDPHWVVVPDED